MKYLIKAFDSRTKTLYRVQSNDIKFIEDKAFTYRAQGLEYKTYLLDDNGGYTEIFLNGRGGWSDGLGTYSVPEGR